MISDGKPRSWFERGTTRNPGPHLDRLPIAFDISGISLTEGLRAAVASGAVLLLGVWFHSFPLLIAAFAANLTCFCDAGGLIRTRIAALLSFTLLGALCWMGFGLLRNLEWLVVVPFAGIAVFLFSMARVWGMAAQTVGNILIVTLALALDDPLGLKAAGVIGASFVAGGVWAVILTVVIWRIQPIRPAARAVERVWLSLAAMSRDLRHVVSGPSTVAQWDAHARAHRRATRTVIEEARLVVADALRSRGPLSPLVRQAEMRLETAETIFAALIALSDVLEGKGPSVRLKAVQGLRLLRPMLVLSGKGVFAEVGRFEAVFARVEGLAADDPALSSLFGTIIDGLRVTMRVSLPKLDTGPPQSVTVSSSMLRIALQPLRDNLTWQSAILRHAVRATVVTLPAIAWSIVWWSPYSHWLTITVALTMQPYFAATWQRVLERVGGTVLGGLIGAAIAFLPQTPLAKAVLLLPLCIIGFSVRQVSYGAYVACLTPLVVVLFDVAVPGHSDSMIATMRLLYTISGGVVAVAACIVLWPSWEPDRLVGELSKALKAYARFAEVLFAACLGAESRAAAEQARRAAGVANNNLEASLSRSLQEPRHSRNPQIEAGLIIDAAMRRLGGALITLQHETAAEGIGDAALMASWGRWVSAALSTLADGRRPEEPAPTASPESTLARLRRAIDVMDTALANRKA